jgi:hypothetical protein
MKICTGPKTKCQLLPHGNYASIAKLPDKISRDIRGILDTFRGILKLEFIYSTTS